MSIAGIVISSSESGSSESESWSEELVSVGVVDIGDATEAKLASARIFGNLLACLAAWLVPLYPLEANLVSFGTRFFVFVEVLVDADVSKRGQKLESVNYLTGCR